VIPVLIALALLAPAIFCIAFIWLGLMNFFEWVMKKVKSST